jgi:hypothetical protein
MLEWKSRLVILLIVAATLAMTLGMNLGWLFSFNLGW